MHFSLNKMYKEISELKDSDIYVRGRIMELEYCHNIDGYSIGNSEKGDITKKIHMFYLEIVSGKVEKYSSWLTKIY